MSDVLASPPTETASWWERFWFRPEPADGLRIVRVVVFGVAAMMLLADRIVLGPAVAEAGALWEPVSFYRLLPKPPSWLLTPAYPVVAAASLAAAWGIGGRWVRLPTGLVAAFMVGLPNVNLGKINHDRNVLVLALIILAFSASTSRGRSWRFRWPVAAVGMAYASMLFFAGIAKLVESGPQWVVSENLRNVIITENLLLRDPALTDMALWVAAEPWRWKAAAAVTLVAELGVIVAWVLRDKPWISYPLIATGAGMILGLNLFLDLGGWPLAVLTLVLVDWNDVRRRAGPWGSSAIVIAAFGAVIAVTFLIRPDSLQWRESAMLVAAAVTSVVVLSRPIDSAEEAATPV